MFNVIVTQFGAENAGEASGFQALGFDPKAFLIQLITFLLVFYVLKRFAFGKIVELLETRRKTIEEGVGLTAKMREEKEKLEKEIAHQRAEARREADKVIANSQAQTAEIIRQAEDTAKEKADKILADAKQKIEDETARARRNLEREMVDLVIEATEAVTRQKLDAKKDNELITDALKGRA
jgi:F-type H+-transporting ATPase subunit b